MLNLVQVLVYYFILPLIYLLILLFDFNLVRRAESVTQRLRMVFGVVAGILFSVIVILLDQTTDLFKVVGGDLPDATSVTQVLPYVVIAFFVGVLLLLSIHVLLKAQQVLSFVVLFTIFAVVVSAYFLLTLSDIRALFAVSSLGFLVGIIIYFMLVPGIVPLLVAGIPPRRADAPRKADWS